MKEQHVESEFIKAMNLQSKPELQQLYFIKKSFNEAKETKKVEELKW